MVELNKIYCADSIKFMSEMDEKSVDLLVTSPRYNVGIDYDECDDNSTMSDYWKFTRQWLIEAYRILKDDGRVAINVPMEVNVQDRGGRVLFVSEFWQIMKEVGYKFFGIVDLDEESPHRSKTTSWGSWMLPSSPYIYNPKECVILAYKKHHIKKTKGTPQWQGEYKMVEDKKTGEFKKKLVYSENDKKDFISLVYGQWNYFADTQQLTKATFSMDIPYRAIKILTYKEDVVFDPFNGSGTTCLAAEMLGRKWIGVDISEKYCEVARKRIKEHQLEQAQTKIVIDETSK